VGTKLAIFDEGFRQLVRFEILTAVVLNCSIFSHVMLSSKQILQTLAAARFMLVSCFDHASTLKTERIHSTKTSTFNGLHGIILQKKTLLRMHPTRTARLLTY
jgi:hypothetical protein